MGLGVCLFGNEDLEQLSVLFADVHSTDEENECYLCFAGDEGVAILFGYGRILI